MATQSRPPCRPVVSAPLLEALHGDVNLALTNLVDERVDERSTLAIEDFSLLHCVLLTPHIGSPAGVDPLLINGKAPAAAPAAAPKKRPRNEPRYDGDDDDGYYRDDAFDDDYEGHGQQS
jgi:hypothetical protein